MGRGETIPKPPLPPELEQFLVQPNPSVIATLRGDGADCHDIDRISRHYTGRAHPQRDRGRFSAWIEVEWWHAWAVGKPWRPEG